MASYLSEPSSPKYNTWSAQAQEEAEELSDSKGLLERQFESLALQLGLHEAAKKLKELRLESSSDLSVSVLSSSSFGGISAEDSEKRRLDHLISEMRTTGAILSLNSDVLDKLASVLSENNNLLERFLTQMSKSAVAMKYNSTLLERLISRQEDTRPGGMITLKGHQDVSETASILAKLLTLVLIFNNRSGCGSG